MAKETDVTLTIYDIDGTLIRELLLGKIPADYYTSRDKAIHWDGCNRVGEKVASGVYFYTLTAGGYRATRRMLILK